MDAVSTSNLESFARCLTASDHAGASVSTSFTVDIARIVNGTVDNDILSGTAQRDYLSGWEGEDFLDGQGGGDTLSGDTGSDRYFFRRGYGETTVQETVANTDDIDLALFDVGVAPEQLWFAQRNDDLQVSIIGTGDKLIFSNWYLGAQHRVEQFKTGDGQTLLDTQVQNLVQAMAGLTPPAPGETSLSAAYQSSLASVIAANWQQGSTALSPAASSLR